MVNSWAAAHQPEKVTVFQPAFGVRQVEIGFASITGLLSGLILKRSTESLSASIAAFPGG
jgi:hypothetical protein